MASKNNLANISYCELVSFNPRRSPTPPVLPIPIHTPGPIAMSNTSIIDSGVNNIHLTPIAPAININPSAPTSFVGVAYGQPQRSSVTCNLPRTRLPVCNSKIMPTFKHNLIVIGKFCDHGCKVLFEQDGVTITSKDDTILLKGCRKQGGVKLW